VQSLPPPQLESNHRPRTIGSKFGRRRLLIFLSVLVISALIGTGIVYVRDPIYRASASVLTVKPKAIDTRSMEADVEHVAIQRRLLLGETLLDRLASDLAEEAIYTDGAELLNRLTAQPVPETNLLELSTRGGDPAELQVLINRWAEAYEAFRAEEIEALSGRTIAELEQQQQQLDAEIGGARASLQTFREANDIISLERDENRSLASLKGLNQSLNKAREQLVEAQAHQAAIVAAVQGGEIVVPDELKSDIARLRIELQRAQQQLSGLREKYTDVYLSADPALKHLPGQVRGMERQLVVMEQVAGQTAVDEANQAVNSARATMQALEEQLVAQQAAVQDFTERFKEFQRLEENLSRLETLYADNAERLARIQLRNHNEYPPIQVVEWARLPETPIAPDYERDLMIALGTSLALALFVTWLVDYLGSSARQEPQPPAQVDVHIHGAPGNPQLDAVATQRISADEPADSAPASLPRQRAIAPPMLPTALTSDQVSAMLTACAPAPKAYAVLLLNGVSPYELPLLHAGCFDADRWLIEIPGASRRHIEFSADHWSLLEPLLQRLTDAGRSIPVAELDQHYRQAARTAAIEGAADVSALGLWHSFVVYLVRQGIDFNDLQARVGTIVPEIEAALRDFAPPGATVAKELIHFSYPLQVA
jgi:uncharacterized protein involved in exopolysaccharide biosynthesis